MKLVFVSSTFKDMQFERDLLQTYAIPTLNERLREYGERAYFGDLRWGVNTSDMDSDEGNRKVLKVCLDEIDNCKPYMIVLIGERYGWIPAQELIDEACVLKGIEKIKDISVTELEIDYGALLDPDYEGRILFYFRELDKTGMTEQQRRDYEAESDLHYRKIEQLKARIQETYPEHIRYYDAVWDAEKGEVTGLEDFLSQVEDDLSAIFLKDLAEYNSIPWQERCMRSADRWIREQNASLAEDVANLELDYTASDAEEGVMFSYITGPAGSGKTSMLGWLYTKYADETFLPYVCGLDQYSRTETQFAQVLLYKLEELAGVPHKDYSNAEFYTELLDDLLELQEKVPTCQVFLDNADEDFLAFLSYLEYTFYTDDYQDFNLNFRVAVQEELPFYPFFYSSTKARCIQMVDEDASAVLDGIVKSYHKELSAVVKEHILSKEQSRHGAYLRSIVKRLMILDSQDFAAIRAMGDGMENINRYMLQIVDQASDDQNGILLELIDEAKDRINWEFVDRLLGVLAFVPVKLDQAEYRKMFTSLGWEFNDLDFSLSVRMLEDVVQYFPENGRFMIKNPSIGTAVRAAFQGFDVKPVVEYMLTDAELRPYAYLAAIYDDDVAFFHRIVKETGVEDVSRAIRDLVNNDLQAKAIALLIELSLDEGLQDVNMLPLSHEIRSDNYRRAFAFYLQFTVDAVEQLTSENTLLLRQIMNAYAEGTKCLVAAIPVKVLELLDDAIDIWKNSGIRNLPVECVENVLLVRLKAVNITRSPELFEEYIGGEEFLDHFHSEDPYHRCIVKMKAYLEFYEIMGWLERDNAIDYWTKAWELFDEDAENLARQPEDYICFSRLDDSFDQVLFGKAIFPTSLELMHYEVEYRGNLEYDEEQKDNPIARYYASPLERMKKADCLCRYSDSPVYAVAYLNHMTEFVADEEFEEIGVDEFIPYLQRYVSALEDLKDTIWMKHDQYATILTVMLAVSQYADFDEQLALLLEVAKTDDPFRQIIWNMAKRIFGDDEEMASSQEDFDRYMAVREDYARENEYATRVLDMAFTYLDFEIEGVNTEEDEE